MVPRERRFSTAFLLAQRIASPGATPKAFWLHVSRTSMPQSIQASAPAAAATASTISITSGCFFFIMSQIALRGTTTPVEVSTWVTVTAAYFLAESAASICSGV